jgi:hypothetical protein
MTIACRRDFLKALGASAAAIALPRWLQAAVRPSGKRPNFIFILTDDQRWDAMSKEVSSYKFQVSS